MRYYPSNVPRETEILNDYLATELASISQTLNILVDGHLEKTHVAPEKPRDGNIRYADGTNWNPGGGAGIYYYNGAAWIKL